MHLQVVHAGNLFLLFEIEIVALHAQADGPAVRQFEAEYRGQRDALDACVVNTVGTRPVFLELRAKAKTRIGAEADPVSLPKLRNHIAVGQHPDIVLAVLALFPCNGDRGHGSHRREARHDLRALQVRHGRGVGGDHRSVGLPGHGRSAKGVAPGAPFIHGETGRKNMLCRQHQHQHDSGNNSPHCSSSYRTG